MCFHRRSASVALFSFSFSSLQIPRILNFQHGLIAAGLFSGLEERSWKAVSPPSSNRFTYLRTVFTVVANTRAAGLFPCSLAYLTIFTRVS